MTTLVLLAAVIAMAAQVIGDNSGPRDSAWWDAVGGPLPHGESSFAGSPATGAVSHTSAIDSCRPLRRWPAAFTSAVWPDSRPV